MSMFLPKETSENGPDSPIESGTRWVALHQVKNMVTGLWQAASAAAVANSLYRGRRGWRGDPGDD